MTTATPRSPLVRRDGTLLTDRAGLKKFARKWENFIMAEKTETGMTLEQFTEKLSLEFSMQVSSPEEAQKSILEKILNMDNVDDLLSDNIGGIIHAEDLLDTPLEVLNVKWNQSDFEDGLGFYAVCDARKDDGSAITFGIGSTNAMAQLFKLATLEAFPRRVKIVRSAKQTKSGYYPMWLTAA